MWPKDILEVEHYEIKYQPVSVDREDRRDSDSTVICKCSLPVDYNTLWIAIMSSFGGGSQLWCRVNRDEASGIFTTRRDLREDAGTVRRAINMATMVTRPEPRDIRRCRLMCDLSHWSRARAFYSFFCISRRNECSGREPRSFLFACKGSLWGWSDFLFIWCWGWCEKKKRMKRKKEKALN